MAAVGNLFFAHLFPVPRHLQVKWPYGARPCAHICQIRISEPERFIADPVHQILRVIIQGRDRLDRGAERPVRFPDDKRVARQPDLLRRLKPGAGRGHRRPLIQTKIGFVPFIGQVTVKQHPGTKTPQFIRTFRARSIAAGQNVSML